MNDRNRPVTIDVISDVMCPWCLIGKRRLERALASREATAVRVRWHPFQLDASIPEEGMDRQDYLNRKFGGPDRARKAYEAVRAAGVEEGVDFKFEDIRKSPNTINAHRLIRLAETMDVQNEVVERLFALYFLEGGDLTDKTTLAENARRAGMDPVAVETLLAGEDGKDAVTRDVAAAAQMGVTGVPCFIVDGEYAVMGAQPADVIAGAIDRALEGRSDRPSQNGSPTPPDGFPAIQ